MSKTVLGEFGWRGLIAQISDEAGLAAHLQEGAKTVYCGFDPTADSLHIGSLVPLLALQRMQLLGHRPIVLVGGATGLIGDPSFRGDERSLNSPEVVEGWVAKIRRQVEPYVSFEGGNAAILVNNLDWTAGMGVITFLRDIGKHFSVNAMVARDSVRARLEREGQGISFTEFSYMLLQGMHFLELARRYDCSLQIGGSDQWGNIVSGIDLIRRSLHRQAFGMTLPLVTKSDGSKFGKTASGTVWLDPEKTSPYAFFQFWLNTSDADVIPYLKFFTHLANDEIESLNELVRDRPQAREAQRVLAKEVTLLVHGPVRLREAERITGALFGGSILDLHEEDFDQLSRDGIPCVRCVESHGLLAALVDTGLCKSTSEARKLVASGGVSVNGGTVPAAETGRILRAGGGLFGRYFLLRKGKKGWALADIENKLK